MKCYTARADSQEEGTIIIARSGSHAADIFVTHFTTLHGAPPPAFTISKNDLRRIPFMEDLRAIMHGAASGVVDFSEEEGHILIPM